MKVQSSPQIITLFDLPTKLHLQIISNYMTNQQISLFISTSAVFWPRKTRNRVDLTSAYTTAQCFLGTAQDYAYASPKGSKA